MSRQNIAAEQGQEIESLLSRLTEAITRVDADDLSGLAQMHGWCEALSQIAGPTSSGNQADLSAQLANVAQSLEALILGEVANSSDAFAYICASIRGLAISPSDLPGSQETGGKGVRPTLPERPKGCCAQSEPDPLSAPSQTIEPEPVPASVQPTVEPVAEQSESEAASVKAEETYVSEPLILDAKELDFVKGFVEEAGEHIESIESAVLEVERCPGDTAKIDDLFRPFHTIKGMAGFLNLRDINCLTHEVETLLDQGRKGKREVTTGVIDLVLSVVDVLKVQIAAVAGWVAEPGSEPVSQPPVAEIIDRLRGVVAGKLDPDNDSDSPAIATRIGAAPVQAESDPVSLPCAPEESRPASELPAGQPPADSTDTKLAEAQRQSAAKPGEQSIRIDTEKLDALIDMVGELVIAQTLVNLSSEVAANPKLCKDVTQVTKIVRDVQELAMAMRMVPIGPTFQKMARLVRDVSRKAGKQVNLSISGEDTELDKTVIQEIGDPLVHMVRNAVDHGIESPAERLAAGKPETGQVHLHAGHEGGNIVISIRDDGKGLDPAVLRAKAIDKGLIRPEDELSEQEIFALVFAPGFSTAAQVTDISGRGVGMDVVKRNIEQLRGRVEIVSEKGRGTTFIIRLPLTLAIIDGMVIRVGSERFILPTITIQQSLRPQPQAITTVHHRGEVLNVRGEMIPLIQLGELFGLTGRIDPLQAMVIIAHCEGRLVGLVVEELIGQQQVVIKTLGERFESLQGVSGAAILGDGRVGLILEMTGLSAAHEQFTRADRCRVNRSTTARQIDGDTTERDSTPVQEPELQLAGTA